MQTRGKFIVLEGLDGSGVTTHSTLLKKWLIENGHRAHHSAEPTDSPIGALIRLILKNYWKIPKRPDILGLLYAADRLYHVNYETYGHSGTGGIHNALHEGYIVVYNRYILSSLAYQSVPSSGVEVDVKWLQEINRYSTGNGGRTPDITFFLDVPPDECMKRITFQRESYELFESYNNLKVVYDNFKRIIREHIYPVIEINGMQDGKPRPLDEVQAEIRSYVKNELNENQDTKKRGRKHKLENINTVDRFITSNGIELND